MDEKFKLSLRVAPLILTLLLTGCNTTSNTKNEKNYSTSNLENSMASQNSENVTQVQNDESESQNEEVKPYKGIIEKHKKFITAVAEGNLTGEEEEWMEEPWGSLRSYFLNNEKNLKTEACYALKDLNNDGKPELILLLKDYTIQAIYTLSEDGTPKLVDHYWERNEGFLYKYINPDNSEDSKIYICSRGSNGASNSSMELASLCDSISASIGDKRGLLVEEKYIYDESRTGKTYPHYTADGPFKLYNTHCFYSNLERTNRPITEQDYALAIEKYATTDQTKKVGLELKPLF